MFVFALSKSIIFLNQIILQQIINFPIQSLNFSVFLFLINTFEESNYWGGLAFFLFKHKWVFYKRILIKWQLLFLSQNYDSNCSLMNMHLKNLQIFLINHAKRKNQDIQTLLYVRIQIIVSTEKYRIDFKTVNLSINKSLKLAIFFEGRNYQAILLLWRSTIIYPS